MNPKLTVRVISPKQILFSGEALSISSKNSFGKFDILPSHAKFLTFIENQKIEVKTVERKNLEFKFPFAIIYNNDNKVDIFTDITVTKI